MSRLVVDKNGAYDLSHVTHITQVPQFKDQGPGLAKIEGPAIAKLHFDSGGTHSTLLPYEDTVNAWLDVKRAEGHPSDSPLHQMSSEERPS